MADGTQAEAGTLRKRGWIRAFFVAASVILAAVVAIVAQQSTNPLYPTRENATPSPPAQADGSPNQFDPFARPTEEQRKALAAMNLQRRKDLVTQTDRMVELAGKLNDEVSKDPAARVTEVQLIQVAEIEKLAHQAQHRMKESWAR